MKRSIPMFLLMACLAVSVRAGNEVSVRLVAVQPGPSSQSIGVDDVLDVLKKNLGENRYMVSAEDKIKLPADKQSITLAPVLLICSGNQKSLQISVRTKSKEVINTNVELEDGKPFILGGTSGKKSKFILVFVVK